MSNESSGKKALRAGMGYTIGNILIRGLSFISLPIFARLLTVSDFGVYTNFSAYVSIVSIIISFALHASIKNAKFDYEEQTGSFCSSVTLLILANTAFLLLIGTLFRAPLSTLLSLEHPYLVILVVAESFCMAMITFYNNVLSVDYKYKEYLILSAIYAVFGVILSVALILTACQTQRYLGRILGALFVAFGITVYIFIRLYRTALPRFNREYWRYGMKISLPIVPHGLSQLLLAQFDRIMIKATIGSTEAGLYGFSYNIGTIFQVITNSLDTAWTPWFFEQMTAKDYANIRKVGRGYTLFVSLGAIALLLVAPEVILILGGSKYAESRYVTFPIVLAMFYAFLYTLPASVEYYYKKTTYIAIGTMSAAAINIVLNLIFIPRFGYIAAAYTTVVCYLLYYVFHVILSRRIHGSIIYDMPQQLLCLAAVTAAAFICLALADQMLIRWAILVAGLIVAAVWALRHKEMIRTLIADFRKK